MRNRIMHVQQIERFRLEHFEHFRGQRERVRRMVKQWVTYNFDLVKMNALTAWIQPDGRSIADEVNVMAPRGQLDAQLGRHDAGAAVSGVAGDADAHGLGVETLPSF